MATDASKRVVDLNAAIAGDLDSEAVLLMDRASWKTADTDAKQLTYDIIKASIVDSVSDYREDPPASSSWFDNVNIRSGIAEDTWTEVDLSAYVGAAAKAAHVSITLANFSGGTVNDLSVYYRPANLTDTEDVTGMIIHESYMDYSVINSIVFFAVVQLGSGDDIGKFDIRVTWSGTATTVGSVNTRIARSDN